MMIQSIDQLKVLYNEALGDVKIYLSGLSKKTSARKCLAYILKGVAIIGGIAIGTGLPERTAQLVGVAIVFVGAVDLILTNHKKLVAYATGESAIKFYLEFLEGEERELAAKVINLQDSNKQEEAGEVQRSFYTERISEIHDKQRETIRAVDAADLQALYNLAVQQPDEKK